MALRESAHSNGAAGVTALIAAGDDAADGKPLHRQHWVLPAGGGDLSKLSLQSADIDAPSAGEVCVRIEAIGLNFADVFSTVGLYGPVRSGEISGRFVPGLEFSGVVERIGADPGPDPKDGPASPSAATSSASASASASTPDTLHGEAQIKHGGQLVRLSPAVWEQARAAARGFAVGDRVMGATRFGSYATLLNVPAHQVRRVPEGWTALQAAAFPVQTLTAYYALTELGAVRAAKTVLVHSCAGGCGMQAVEICHRLGAYVVGTVGSAGKVAPLLARFPKLRREQVIVRDASLGARGFAKQLEAALDFIRASTQDASIDGFDCVLDAVMGDLFEPGFKALRPTGRYVVYGAASMTPREDSLGVAGWLRLAWQYLRRPKVDPLDIIGLNKSVMGFNLIHCLNDAKLLTGLFEEIEALDLPPPHVGNVFKFHEVVQALRLFKSGATTGKVVVAV